MNNAILDQQFANLFGRAGVDPYFDLEHALCVLMESHMQQSLAIPMSRQLRSIAKIFSWPSEELCACLHRSEADRMYVFDANKNELTKIESVDPTLFAINRGNRVIILNEWTARHLDQNILEQLVSRHAEDPDELLEQELRMRAYVNARGDASVSPDYFMVSAIRA